MFLIKYRNRVRGSVCVRHRLLIEKERWMLRFRVSDGANDDFYIIASICTSFNVEYVAHSVVVKSDIIII